MSFPLLAGVLSAVSFKVWLLSGANDLQCFPQHRRVGAFSVIYVVDLPLRPELRRLSCISGRCWGVYRVLISSIWGTWTICQLQGLFFCIGVIPHASTVVAVILDGVFIILHWFTQVSTTGKRAKGLGQKYQLIL